MVLNEWTAMEFELKHGLNAYFASLPPGRRVKSLADLIAFNEATPREMALFDQDLFIKSQSTSGLSDPAYVKARAALGKFSRDTLDKLFTQYRIDALIRSTDDPSFRVDIVKSDNDSSTSPMLPATAGYPHLTVPMGMISGLPVGLSFIGPAWSEAKLLQLGYAYEKIGPTRIPPKFIPALENAAAISKAFAPLPK